MPPLSPRHLENGYVSVLGEESADVMSSLDDSWLDTALPYQCDWFGKPGSLGHGIGNDGNRISGRRIGRDRRILLLACDRRRSFHLK